MFRVFRLAPLSADVPSVFGATSEHRSDGCWSFVVIAALPNGSRSHGSVGGSIGRVALQERSCWPACRRRRELSERLVQRRVTHCAAHCRSSVDKAGASQPLTPWAAPTI